MAKELPNNRSDNRFNKKDWVRHNEQIRIPQVLVIHNGKNLGVMSNRSALDLARANDLDLVEVSPNSRPPVCHIIDYGKFMYEKQKKQKESSSKQAQIKEKEVDFRYVIGDNDLQTKVNQIRGFLAKGFKVRCVCKFRQRENAHKSQGFGVLKKVIEMVQDIAEVESGPKFDGNNVFCKIDVKKNTNIKTTEK
jgi:translation initiation factor IF-3